MPTKNKLNRNKPTSRKVKVETNGETMGGEGLVFDYHTIRLIIGLIAMLFPLVVRIRAAQITDSISWSYYTDARDFFVGFLFVLGAFLICYKGRNLSENLVGWAGGIAACVTALSPTSFCTGANCPSDWKSNVHYMGAIVLFSTTVYFCLVAFLGQVNMKIKEDEATGVVGFTSKRRRKVVYLCCGWGIAIVMLGLFIMNVFGFNTIKNITYWVETVALELFGIAWAVASQYLPFVTDEVERQRLF